MTDNAKKVLSYLQEAGSGAKFTAKDVQAALGFEKVGAVVGTVSGLARKGARNGLPKLLLMMRARKRRLSIFL